MVSTNVDKGTKKASKGKQKIEIKKIDKKSSRQVTFTKRRHGLFSKCSELHSLFGSEVAVVTFSVAGKPIVAGYPSPDSVIQRYITDSSGLHSRNDTNATAAWSCSGTNWWDNPVDNMRLEELERFKAALEGLRKETNSRVNEMSCVNDGEISNVGSVVDASSNCGQFEDYSEFFDQTMPQLYPELLPFDGSCSFDRISCC